LILPDSGSACKTGNCGPADPAFPPAQAELICPRCYREASFSTTESHVWCPTCGWIHTLTPEECETLVDALAGITDLNTQVYLQVLAAWDMPVPVAANAQAV
jgi:hypothetical protein